MADNLNPDPNFLNQPNDSQKKTFSPQDYYRPPFPTLPEPTSSQPFKDNNSNPSTSNSFEWSWENDNPYNTPEGQHGYGSGISSPPQPEFKIPSRSGSTGPDNYKMPPHKKKSGWLVTGIVAVLVLAALVGGFILTSSYLFFDLPPFLPGPDPVPA